MDLVTHIKAEISLVGFGTTLRAQVLRAWVATGLPSR